MGRRVVGLWIAAVALLAGCGSATAADRTATAGLASSPWSGPTTTSVPVTSSAPSPGPASTVERAATGSSIDLDALRPLPPAAGIPTTTRPGIGPVGLRIPSIGLTDSPVVAVGVEANGELTVPAVDEIGWYRFGSSPGRAGSAVLAAHIAFDGVDGVFRHLSTIAVGDPVEVELADGSVVHYEITEVVEYLKTELPSQLFSEDGDDRLVLITCGGDFNPTVGSYRSNIVAVAERR